MGTTEAATGKTRAKWVGVVASSLLGVGLLLIAIAVMVNFILAAKFSDRSVRTTGTVIDMVQKTKIRDGRTGYTYCPVIEYAANGQHHTFRSGHCSSGAPNIGESIDVRYNPNDPTEVSEDSWAARWLAVVIPSIIGVVMLVIGGGSFWAWRRGLGTTSGTSYRWSATWQPGKGFEPTPPNAAPESPERRPFIRPNFPPARPGTAGYDVTAVNVLVSRVEQAYQQVAAGTRHGLTAADFNGGRLPPAYAMGAGYDQPTVDMWLSGVRSDLGV